MTVRTRTSAAAVVNKLVRDAVGALPGTRASEAKFETGDVNEREAVASGSAATLDGVVERVEENQIRIDVAVWDEERMIVEGVLVVPGRKYAASP